MKLFITAIVVIVGIAYPQQLHGSTQQGGGGVERRIKVKIALPFAPPRK